MMSDDEIIAVVSAHKEGKQIQWTALGNNDWQDSWTHIHWNFSIFDYRIKPEPRKPREWWAEIPLDGSIGQIFTDSSQKTKGGELVRVREVIEYGV